MKTQLILLLAAFLLPFLISCSKETNNEYPDVTAAADTIRGTLKYRTTTGGVQQIANWPFGVSTFKVIVGAQELLASGNIDTLGSFTVVLPASISGVYLMSLQTLADQLKGNLTVTPQTLRFLGSIQYVVEYTDNGEKKNLPVNLYTLKADKTADRSYFYNFYDLDGSFKGNSMNLMRFNWTFAKGWGMVENYKFRADSDSVQSTSVASAPATAVWVNN
jgi:hypothetical protein